MTLSTAELLRGNAASLGTPPPPESAGDFMAGAIGVIALINILAAQEIESGAAIRHAENQAIRGLFLAAIEAGAAGDLEHGLRALAAEQDSLRLDALDAANDRLRAALISLHVHAETAKLQDLEGAILRLLAETAAARVLAFPAM